MCTDDSQVRAPGPLDGLDDGSGEESSEQSANSRQKARTPKTPGASRLSKSDHSFSQMLHKLEEMDRRQTAQDALEVRHHHCYRSCSLVHGRGRCFAHCTCQQITTDLQEAHRKAQRMDMQARNQLAVAQMQQQATMQQQLLTAMVQIATAGAQPAAPAPRPVLGNFGAPQPRPPCKCQTCLLAKYLCCILYIVLPLCLCCGLHCMVQHKFTMQIAWQSAQRDQHIC